MLNQRKKVGLIKYQFYLLNDYLQIKSYYYKLWDKILHRT